MHANKATMLGCKPHTKQNSLVLVRVVWIEELLHGGQGAGYSPAVRAGARPGHHLARRASGE